MPTVVLGSYLTLVVPGRLLRLLTGLFVTAVGVRLLARPLAAESKKEHTAKSLWLLLGVDTGIGLRSGLLANGGGFLLVLVYLLLCDMEAQEAAATSLVTVAFLALPGTWIHWQLGHIDLSLVLLLALGGLPFTYLGAHRTGGSVPIWYLALFIPHGRIQRS
jgi:hypothetical protein